MSAEKSAEDVIDLGALAREAGIGEAPEAQPQFTSPSAPGPIQVVDVPATIALKNGGVFEVTELQSWGFNPMGLIATGNWAGQENETDVLIPYGEYEYIEYDYVSYKAKVEALDPEDEPQFSHGEALSEPSPSD